jgi:BirA family transcriptional regulator, biotin operon repressor / biotin---[acetyl-CoA-carboxylase] ligase
MAPGIHLPDFFLPILLEGVDSTSEEAGRRARQGAPEGTLVWAQEQSAGRGRRGRTWLSPAGNLYCSLLVRPTSPAAEAAQLGFVAGLALAEAAEAVLPPERTVTCKWPNDVLIGGRKVAGILLDASSAGNARCEWVVIGMGINVRWHPGPAEAQFPATSLAAEGAVNLDPAGLLVVLAPLFLDKLARWREQGFAAVRQEWLRRAFGLHQVMNVRLHDGLLSGTFTGLDASGAMMLSCADGPHVVTAGDVVSVRA